MSSQSQIWHHFYKAGVHCLPVCLLCLILVPSRCSDSWLGAARGDFWVWQRSASVVWSQQWPQPSQLTPQFCGRYFWVCQDETVSQQPFPQAQGRIPPRFPILRMCINKWLHRVWKVSQSTHCYYRSLGLPGSFYSKPGVCEWLVGGLEEGGRAGSEIALSPPIRSAAFK